MKEVKAICKCGKCGREFAKYSTTSDARSWEEYAPAHYTVCPICWKAEKDAEDAAKLNEKTAAFPMPEITGKSEKQIAYARDLRARVIARADATDISNAKKILATIGTEKWNMILKNTADASCGGDISRAEAVVLDKLGLRVLVSLARESDAGKIIDLAK